MIDLIVFILITFSAATLVTIVTAEDDTNCLKKFKQSIRDPSNYLSNWDFTDGSSICTFNGVQCWNQQEKKVTSLKLPQAYLTGTFPSGLYYCMSITSVDLSGNSFTGPIPTDICTQMPYLISLDLSNNKLTGEIPANLGNCTYLNILHLQNNELSGSIPWQIGTLARLNSLDLSSNSLSGEIPSDLANKPSSTFSGNKDLCGSPIAKCTVTIFTSLVISGMVLGSALIISTPIWAYWVIMAWRRRRQLKQLLLEAQLIRVELFIQEAQYTKLSQKELLEATTNYSEENVIGRGGSSTVYRAILSNRDLIAVKRLESGFDFPKFGKINHEDKEALINAINTKSSTRKQFLTELDVLGKLRHRNLLRILGYCYNHLDCMAIIMDYMPGSLDDILHSPDPSRRFNLGWKIRLEILIGIAEGLSYLHSEYDGKSRVVHGDLKPANVLLDDNLSPHIADFGLATMVGAIDTLYNSCSHFNNSTASKLHRNPSASNSVVRPWSFGYTAPECSLQGTASVKADVFSFGVVILEVITGERPSSDKLKEGQTLAQWVFDALAINNTDSVERVVAEELRGSEMREWGEQIQKVLRVGCSCADPDAHQRPRMRQVLGFLRHLNNDGDGLVASLISDQSPAPLGLDSRGQHYRIQIDDEDEDETWMLSDQANYER